VLLYRHIGRDVLARRQGTYASAARASPVVLDPMRVRPPFARAFHIGLGFG